MLFKLTSTPKYIIRLSRSYSSAAIVEYVNDLKQRELVKSCYPNDLEGCRQDMRALPPVIYAGFDPTADSLHIGNLLILCNLLRSCAFGCQVIALVGGATATIGDPSGRTTERLLADKDRVSRNADAIASQLIRIAKNADTTEKNFKLVNNQTWFEKMTMIDFLRACKKIRVGEMLRMGAIKSRMQDDKGISFTEFSYQTMQAMDWGRLSDEYQCNFQIGGSDQLGHLDMGAHYIKRQSGRFAAGLCLPLVTDASGKKLGKSSGASIWLCAKRTSPFHFYQFLKQLHDTEAEAMIRQFSLRPYAEVKEIVANHNANLGKWIAQSELAAELTRLVHGVEGLDQALKCSSALFQGSTSAINSLTKEELFDLFGTTTKVEKTKIETMGGLADATRTDKIKGSQLMKKGAFRVNGNKMTNPDELIVEGVVGLTGAPDMTLISWGKRKYQLVQWV